MDEFIKYNKSLIQLKELILPFVDAINTHLIEDKQINTEFILAGGVIRDILLYGEYTNDIDIFCEDVNKVPSVYSALLDMGYTEIQRAPLSVKMQSFKNKVDLVHGFTKDAKKVIIDCDYTVNGVVVDSNHMLHYHPKFFEDLDNSIIRFNYLGKNNTSVYLNDRIERFKNEGFKLSKESRKFIKSIGTCTELEEEKRFINVDTEDIGVIDLDLL